MTKYEFRTLANLSIVSFDPPYKPAFLSFYTANWSMFWTLSFYSPLWQALEIFSATTGCRILEFSTFRCLMVFFNSFYKPFIFMSSALACLIRGLTTSLYILFNFSEIYWISVAFNYMSSVYCFLSAIERLVAASNSDFCLRYCLSMIRWSLPLSITSMYHWTTSFSSFNYCISSFKFSIILAFSSTSLTAVSPVSLDLGSLNTVKPVTLDCG